MAHAGNWEAGLAQSTALVRVCACVLSVCQDGVPFWGGGFASVHHEVHGKKTRGKEGQGVGKDGGLSGGQIHGGKGHRVEGLVWAGDVCNVWHESEGGAIRRYGRCGNQRGSSS